MGQVSRRLSTFYRLASDHAKLRYSITNQTIGNLPSEQVTKRDLFYAFYRYGRLAQVSIKQAYGFVQFHDVAACQRALKGEQGQEIRGRKMREYLLYANCERITVLTVGRSRNIQTSKEHTRCCCCRCPCAPHCSSSLAIS